MTRETFKRRFGCNPAICVRAPGRVNLIGEHLDYNGGHVLPMAIDRGVEIAAALRDDGRFRLWSVRFSEMFQGPLPAAKIADRFWSNYLFGVVHELAQLGHPVAGLDAVVDGDVPGGAGLASSAALEVATAWALAELLGLALSRMEIALIGQRAENRFVGVHCGIMDQAIAAGARAGHAMLLDCLTLEAEQVPLELTGKAAILVAHSGVNRGLTASAYNQRRDQCRTALGIVRLRTGKELAHLCQATPEDLRVSSAAMDEVTARRARHVVGEQARVAAVAAALRAGDFAAAGRLLNASHESLRDDYEVSCPELEQLTSLIRSCDGCWGTRLTGAGFGGCTVSLVAAEVAGEIVAELKRAYYLPRKLEPTVFVTEPAEGVRVL